MHTRRVWPRPPARRPALRDAAPGDTRKPPALPGLRRGRARRPPHRRAGPTRPYRRHPKTIWDRAACEAQVLAETTMRRETGNRMWSVFERRSDLEKILAVAEEGKILAAAERLAISQPALTRAIARLEARLGGRLFERLSTGVRTTPFGDTAAALARGVLREIEAAEEKLDAALAGRTGSFRLTAAPMWLEAVLGPALAGFRERAPGIALTLRAAPFAEGLRLLVRGESDLHCGGRRSRRPAARLPAARALPRHRRRHRRRRGPSAARRHSRARRPRRLAVDRLRPARPRPPAGTANPGHRPGAPRPCCAPAPPACSRWRPGPGSPGCRSTTSTGWPGRGSGRCRSPSAGAAAAPGSSRGAPPRTWSRSACSNGRCATARSGGMRRRPGSSGAVLLPHREPGVRPRRRHRHPPPAAYGPMYRIR